MEGQDAFVMEQLALLKANTSHIGFTEPELYSLLESCNFNAQAVLNQLDTVFGKRVESVDPAEVKHHLRFSEQHNCSQAPDTSSFPPLGYSQDDDWPSVSETEHQADAQQTHCEPAEQHHQMVQDAAQSLAAAGLNVRTSDSSKKKKKKLGGKFKQSESCQNPSGSNHVAANNKPSFIQTVQQQPSQFRSSDRTQQQQQEQHHQRQSRGLTPSAIAPTVPTGGTVSHQYASMRREAYDSARERNKLKEQATRAYLSGDRKTAKQLSQMARQTEATMWQAHSQAADALFGERNAPLGATKTQLPAVDLHGLHQTEALDAVRRFASKVVSQHGNNTRVHLIVGTGKHSKGNQSVAKIPRAVQSQLQNAGLQFAEAAPGTLEVELHSPGVQRL